MGGKGDNNTYLLWMIVFLRKNYLDPFEAKYSSLASL